MSTTVMPKKNQFLNDLVLKIKGQHLHYRNKGLYRYVGRTTLKIIFFYIVFIITATLIGKYLLNFNRLFNYIIDNLSDGFMIIFFFVTESFLGLIPPDLFVIWSAKFETPFVVLGILGILSYIGGIISYQIGVWFGHMPRVKAYTERVLDRQIRSVQKWGGVFIIIAALLPFSPFSMVIIAVSLLRYPFKLYLLFGLARISRFLLQGVLYLDILNLESLLK